MTDARKTAAGDVLSPDAARPRGWRWIIHPPIGVSLVIVLMLAAAALLN